MKKRIFWGVIIGIVLIIQGFMTYETFIKDNTYLRYCKVIKKNDYVEISKHKSHYSSDPKRTLIVLWLDTKEYEELSVTTDTFFTTQEGAAIAFTREHEHYYKNHPLLNFMFFLISVIASIVEACYLGWFIIFLVCYFIYDRNIIDKPLFDDL